MQLATRATTADVTAPATIFSTSGTGGEPKGVVLEHDMLLRSAYGSALTRAFEDGRRILFALAPAAEGELAVRGAIVTHGYHDAAEETAEVLGEDGWLRSGDLGRIGLDGYLRLTGAARTCTAAGRRR